MYLRRTLLGGGGLYASGRRLNQAMAVYRVDARHAEVACFGEHAADVVAKGSQGGGDIGCCEGCTRCELIDLLKWWENYADDNDGSLDNNPSPGNKAGGLTTILEKSLGAAAKGGHSDLVDVYRYAEPVTKRGFVFMDTPGYDPVSATGQVAGGANMICFTTGRGSAYGCKPAPSLKLATNTALFDRQEDDMDINCGVIVDGKASIEQVGQQFFEMILKTASGQPSKSEIFGYGEDEFAPWVLGPTM